MEGAVDYFVPGFFFCLVGWLLLRLGPDSRPGDLILHAMPERVQNGIWSMQRIMGAVALVIGSLNIAYAAVLGVRSLQ